VRRGDRDGALADAQMILDLAEESGNDEVLLSGLALLALTHTARGEQGQAEAACTRLLDRWHAVGGLVGTVPTLAELTALPHTAKALGAAALCLPDASRWKHAFLALAAARYDEAATISRQIGSRPFEACSHLLAAEDHLAHSRRPAAEKAATNALAIYRQLGAASYVRRTEALLASTAARARVDAG